jgi:peptide/nickel transport system permease protein
MGLGRYVTKRLVASVGLVLVVATLNFVIIHLAPGGPETVLLANPNISEEASAKILSSYGLDRPLYEQYIDYLGGLLRGDWPTSYFYSEPASSVIFSRLPATLLLMVPSLALTVIIGILIGVLASRKPYSLPDRLLSSFAFFFYTMPPFWLGLLLLTLLSLKFPVFPAGGMLSVTSTSFNVFDYLHHLVLPVVTLTVVNMATFALLVRSSMIEVLDQNYIVTARGKGLTERVVLYRHALRNGLLPTVTLIGLLVGFLLQGAMLTETIFSWPGLGLLTYDSIFRRDYPVVLSLFFMFSVMTIISNLATDVIYGFLDPRITFD